MLVDLSPTIVIHKTQSQKLMHPICRLAFNPSLWIAIMLISMPFSNFSEFDDHKERIELSQIEMPMYATSPGHTVFGEYVGAHWCGPCMSSASPSLSNLKSTNPEEFTFVSFFESNQGWPNDLPIDRIDHVTNQNYVYPTFSFGDAQSSSCKITGSLGNNNYDPGFTNGGCMSAQSNDFSLELSTSLNVTTEIVTITLTSTYIGALSFIEVFVYGAVTEKIGADSYDNNVKPHHNWRSWLLNEDNDGFVNLNLSQGTSVDTTWNESLSVVRATGGKTSWENFWPVLALMDGPHSSYNEVYSAIDLDMGPLVDIGITELNVMNQNGNLGFISGDILELEVEITNRGVEDYVEGGNIELYSIEDSQEQIIGNTPVSSLQIGDTQKFNLNFDTSDISLQPSGVTTFRAKITNLEGDRNSTNNILDEISYHDMPPSPSMPVATSSTMFERGGSIVFESSVVSNDLVDDISSTTPIFQYSKSESLDWNDSWIVNSELEGFGANAVYVHQIQTPTSAEAGYYDIRVRWEDGSGQLSDWYVVNEAFKLRNALPKVLSSLDVGFVGNPTVKVDTLETVSLVGLIRDAETPLSLLEISSSDSQFKSWNPTNSEITVKFDEIFFDSSGNPLPQAIEILMNDGEDINSGILFFNIIENGAPRWNPIPVVSVPEGGENTISLTEYLSDTLDDGITTNPTSELSISIISNNNEDLISASIEGQILSVLTTDKDLFGSSELTIRANDGIKYSDKIISIFVYNINDPPTIISESIPEMTVKSGEQNSINLKSSITDIDDPDSEIWVSVSSAISGSVQYDYSSGDLSFSWDESGTQSITLTVVDRHGGWSTFNILVEVLDKKPLVWFEEDFEGDLQPIVENAYYGMNPTVRINNLGNLQLSEIKVTWTVCNSILGICHSNGFSNTLGPFQIIPSSGAGLGIGDYITLSVDSVDSDGWDRSSTELYKMAAINSPFDLPESTSQNPFNEQDNDLSEDNSNNELKTNQLTSLAYISFLIISIFIGTMAGLFFSRKNNDDLLENSISTSLDEQLKNFEKDKNIVTNIPESGIPEGWTLEQWNHYGAEYLRKLNQPKNP